MKRNIERQPWERREKESPKAYAALCSYRDLGPTRSVEKAFAALNPGKKRSGRPAEWYVWSRRFEWVARVNAWDEYQRGVEDTARLERLRELARKRSEAEFEAFNALLEDIRENRELLKKVRTLPVTDVEVIEQMKDGSRRKRVRGIDIAKLAQLAREIRDAWRDLVNGPRSDNTPSPQESAEDIEWEKPDERAA